MAKESWCSNVWLFTKWKISRSIHAGFWKLTVNFKKIKVFGYRPTSLLRLCFNTDSHWRIFKPYLPYLFFKNARELTYSPHFKNIQRPFSQASWSFLDDKLILEVIDWLKRVYGVLAINRLNTGCWCHFVLFVISNTFSE